MRRSSPGGASASSGTSTGSTPGSGGSSSTAAVTGCAPAGAGRSSVRCRCSGTSTPGTGEARPAGIRSTAVADRDELDRAIATLDPDHVVVIALRFASDLSIAEIAARVGIPEGHRQVPAPPRAAAVADRARARRRRGGHDRRRPRDPPPRALRRSSARRGEPALRDRLAGIPMDSGAGAASGPGFGWRGPPSRRSRPSRSGSCSCGIALVDRSLGPVLVGTPSPHHHPRPRCSCPATASRRRRSTLSFWLLAILVVAVIALVVRVVSEAAPPPLGGVDRRGPGDHRGPQRPWAVDVWRRRSWTRGASRPAPVGSRTPTRTTGAHARTRRPVHAGSERVVLLRPPHHERRVVARDHPRALRVVGVGAAASGTLGPSSSRSARPSPGRRGPARCCPDRMASRRGNR